MNNYLQKLKKQSLILIIDIANLHNCFGTCQLITITGVLEISSFLGWSYQEFYKNIVRKTDVKDQWICQCEKILTKERNWMFKPLD